MSMDLMTETALFNWVFSLLGPFKPNPKMKTEDVADIIMWMVDSVDKFRVLDMVIAK